MLRFITIVINRNIFLFTMLMFITKEDIATKLIAFRESKSLTQAELAKSLHVGRSTIAQIEAGNANITIKMLQELVTIYNIDLNDFLTNDAINVPLKYELNNHLNTVSEPSPTYLTREDTMQVRVVEEYAYAGYTHGFRDKEFIDHLPVRETKKRDGGNYLFFKIVGDSMDYDGRKCINSGDELLTKELPTSFWKYKLHIPKVFIIVHKDGILCKEIIDHDVDKGIVTCHSFNPKIKDFKLNLKDVSQLWYMVEHVKYSD